MLASLLVALAQAVRKAVALLAARAPPVAAPAAVSLSANASDVAKAIRLSLVRWPDGRVKYVPYLATSTPSSGEHARELHIKVSLDGGEAGQLVPVSTLISDNVSIAWGCCTVAGRAGARAHLIQVEGEPVALRPEQSLVAGGRITRLLVSVSGGSERPMDLASTLGRLGVD